MSLSSDDVDYIRTQLLIGATREDLFYDFQDEGDLPHALATIDDAITLRRAELDAEEPGPTSMQAAIADLAQMGILARENFSCCSTCLMTEIADERDDTRTWTGWVAYHRQDAEDVVTSHSAHVSFDIFPAAHWTPQEFDALPDEGNQAWDAAAVAMMRDQVIPVLTAHGMTVEWNGSIEQRPLVKGVDYVADIRGPEWDRPTDVDVLSAGAADDDDIAMIRLSTSIGTLTFLRAASAAADLETTDCVLAVGEGEDDAQYVVDFLVTFSNIDPHSVLFILNREDAEAVGLPASMLLHLPQDPEDDDPAFSLASVVAALTQEGHLLEA